MNNYFNFVKTIKSISLANGLVNETGEGDIYTHLNSGVHKYPCVFLTVENIVNTTNDTMRINGTLFYVDRLCDNEANKVEVQSNGITILQQIIDKISEETVWTLTANVFTPFTEKFSDMCAGQFVSFTVDMPNEIVCSSSEYEIKTIELTKNGLYDITGYDKALVNVITKWGDIEGNIEEQTDLINYIDSHSTPAEWGNITGNIENQTDLNDKLTDLDTRIGDVEDAVSNIEPFTPSTIVPTTTNFVPDTDYTIHESLQRTANLFGGVQGEIDDINAKVPAQASSQNQLADKNFVNSTVATNAANFRGNWVTWNDVPTDVNLYPKDYAGNRTPTNNDYLVVQDASAFYPQGEELEIQFLGNYGRVTINGETKVLFNYIESNPVSWTVFNGAAHIYGYRYAYTIYLYADVTVVYNGNAYAPNQRFWAANYDIIQTIYIYQVLEHLDGQWRFMYVGDWDTLGKSGWQAQYKVGSSFTAAQQAALDSNITAQKVATYDGYGNSISALQTDKVDKVYTANKIYATNGQGQQTAVGVAQGLYFGGNNINVNIASDSERGIAKLYNQLGSAQDGAITPYGVSRALQTYQPLLANTGHIHISKNTSGALSARFVDKERPIIVGRAIPCKTRYYFSNLGDGTLTTFGKPAFSYLSGSRYLVSGNVLKITFNSQDASDEIYNYIVNTFPDAEVFRTVHTAPYTSLIRIKIDSTKMPIVRMPFFDYDTTTLTSYMNVIKAIISDICNGDDVSGYVRWANKDTLNFDKTASPYVTVSQGIIRYNKPIYAYKPQNYALLTNNKYKDYIIPPLHLVWYDYAGTNQHSNFLCCDVYMTQGATDAERWETMCRKFDIRVLRKIVHKYPDDTIELYPRKFVRPGYTSTSPLYCLRLTYTRSHLWSLACKWKRNKHKISTQKLKLSLRCFSTNNTRIKYKCNIVP